MWWPGTESNRRRQPFQGCALPTELPGLDRTYCSIRGLDATIATAVMIVPPAMLSPKVILLGIVAGAAAGSLVALVASRMFRRGELPQLAALWVPLLIDAVLGAIGFVGGTIGIASLPALKNLTQTTTTTQSGGVIIHTITHHYENAYRLALGVAVLLAVVGEVIRYLLRRRQPSPA